MKPFNSKDDCYPGENSTAPKILLSFYNNVMQNAAEVLVNDIYWASRLLDMWIIDEPGSLWTIETKYVKCKWLVLVVILSMYLPSTMEQQCTVGLSSIFDQLQ